MTQNGIVILALECDATNALVHSLQKDYPIAGIILEQPVSKKILIKNRIKKLGWFKVFGQLLFIVTVPKILRSVSAKRVESIKSQTNLDTSSINKQLITNIDSVNSDECISLLKAAQPKLVILSGARIVSQKVLNSIDATFLNIHAGITPLYRGVHGAYWALAEANKDLCGVTLHYVDKGIDTGSIIEQHLIEPTKEDNFYTYPYLQMAEGIYLLKKNLPSILKEKIQQPPFLADKSQLRYHPTLLEYLKIYFTKKVK